MAIKTFQMVIKYTKEPKIYQNWRDSHSEAVAQDHCTKANREKRFSTKMDQLANLFSSFPADQMSLRKIAKMQPNR
jgi:hypothetical protein